MPGQAATSVTPAPVGALGNRTERAATSTCHLLVVIWPPRAGLSSRLNPLKKRQRPGARVLVGWGEQALVQPPRTGHCPAVITQLQPKGHL